jgi:hypothetical protein
MKSKYLIASKKGIIAMIVTVIQYLQALQNVVPIKGAESAIFIPMNSSNPFPEPYPEL